jgi:hypothetical protein
MHTKPAHAFEYLVPLVSTFCRRASKVSVPKTVMLTVVKMVVVMAGSVTGEWEWFCLRSLNLGLKWRAFFFLPSSLNLGSVHVQSHVTH